MTLPPQNHGAHELKFILSDALVTPVIEWARQNIPPDPNAEVPGGDGYAVNSLYFDRNDLSVFHRRPGFSTRKYRVRRYGKEARLFLEEKEKKQGWVRKRRTAISELDLGRVAFDESDWEGAWFARILREQELVPQSQVSYQRVARVGEAEGSPIRLTVDRELRCVEAHNLTLPPLGAGEAEAISRNILELKFGNFLPHLYKELIREFGLQPDSSSKYRLSIMQTGRAREEVTA